MRKIMIFLSAVLLLASCSDFNGQEIEIDQPIKVENGRMIFQSATIYRETVTKLNSMDVVEFETWVKSHTSNSYYTRIHEASSVSDGLNEINLNDFRNAPPSIQALVNRDLEVQIGDTIVWYNDGIKHFVPNKNEELLMQIKADPTISTLKGEYSIQLMDKNKDSKTGRSIVSSLDARWQKQFTYINGTQRKFVHELYVFNQTNFNIPGGYYVHSILYLRVKLEYRTSQGNWRVAGETRNISLDFTSNSPKFYSSGSLVAPVVGPNQYFSGNFTRSNDLLVVIGEVGNAVVYYGYPTYWDIELTGTIYQYIQGDLASNAWYNSAYPLW